MAEYKLMYLKQLKLVTRAARPSLIDSQQSEHPATNRSVLSTHRMTSGTQRMSNTLEVNGAATDASASESEMPTSAAFKAPQSFAPSPQNPQQ